MHQQSISRTLLGLARSFRRLNLSDPLTQCLAPRVTRSFASQTTFPVTELAKEIQAETASRVTSTPSPITDPTESSRILTTLHSWPELEPVRWAWYGSQYLDMPLRRDLLHRAVIYEGDSHRKGTASTKWRGEVHGSNRKIQPQKGTGRARVGDKKSPIRKGGGVAHGPKPRSVATGLQRKVYDQAWRTALSYRYRKGELIILDDEISWRKGATERLLNSFFEANRYGKGHGRSMLVADTIDPHLGGAMKRIGEHGLIKDIEDVDVKDLLETGRIVIERQALDALLVAHSSDILSKVPLEQARQHTKGPRLDGGLSIFETELSASLP